MEAEYCLPEIRALAQWLRENGVHPQAALELFKAEVLKGELTAVGGNQSALAEVWGMHRNTVRRQLDALGVATPKKVRCRRK